MTTDPGVPGVRTEDGPGQKPLFVRFSGRERRTPLGQDDFCLHGNSSRLPPQSPRTYPVPDPTPTRKSRETPRNKETNTRTPRSLERPGYGGTVGVGRESPSHGDPSVSRLGSGGREDVVSTPDTFTYVDVPGVWVAQVGTGSLTPEFCHSKPEEGSSRPPGVLTRSNPKGMDSDPLLVPVLNVTRDFLSRPHFPVRYTHFESRSQPDSHTSRVLSLLGDREGTDEVRRGWEWTLQKGSTPRVKLPPYSVLDLR